MRDDGWMSSEDDSNSKSVLDIKRLGRLVELEQQGAAGLVRQTISVYLDSSAYDLEQIKTAVLDGQIDRVQKTAHRLKSSCSVIGLFKVENICRQLESANEISHTSLISQLETELHAAKVELTNYLQSH